MNGSQMRVFILADDADFGRTVTARWQAERVVPAFTLLGSKQVADESLVGCELTIVGPVKHDAMSVVLKALESHPGTAILVTEESALRHSLRAAHPRLLILELYDGWLDCLVMLGSEVLRRIEAEARAAGAERAANFDRRHATLGCYMLEMRHGLNNALTSVLGNAELLLLEPGALSAQVREQMETIRDMAMRMHEVMQRFSSLEFELQLSDKVARTDPGRLLESAVRT
ncbi:MAG TPA: hypothetical protein VGQ71_14905 [Terriglobales bacterium]|nr:hypothetical protein [Terriglobales bacterium]